MTTTTGRVEPQKVLKAALDANPREVLILAIAEDGEPYYASSSGDTYFNIAICEQFKYSLLAGEIGDE